MAILVLCRASSSLRWAATTVGLSALCGTLLAAGGRDADGGLTAALAYGLQGLAIDLFWAQAARPLAWGLGVGLLAGLAHTLKPLLRALVEAGSGLAFGSLLQGLATPLLSHLAFGFVGGWLTWLALQAGRRRSR